MRTGLQAIAVAAALALGAMGAADGAAAQQQLADARAPATAAPAPDDGLTVAVFGDSLGDGVWSGLYLLLRKDKNAKVVRHTKVGAGLTRPDWARWFEDFKAQVAAEPMDVAVVMFGANDHQGLRDENRRGYAYKSEGWKSVYGARVEAILGALKEKGVRTIWLGLPIMRKDEYNTGSRVMDGIFASVAERMGARFVPLASDFASENGDFQTHMVDQENRMRALRMEDGVHFTPYGYLLVARKALTELERWQSEAARAGGAAPVAAAPVAAPVAAPAGDGAAPVQSDGKAGIRPLWAPDFEQPSD